MATVLVTGIAGFIGSNLARRLIGEGHRVIGIDDLSQGVRSQVPEGCEFHQEDIRSEKIFPLFQNAGAVFHLAAKNCISDCQKDPVQTSHINVTGTVNVLEASRRAGVKKVILAESSALYEGSKLLPTPETEVHPESFYAVSKLAQREFTKAYERFYGLNCTTLRYFCVYGPRQDYRRTLPPVISAFILKLLKKERPVIYGNGKKKRDFIHVDDINDFHLLCLKDPRTDGKTFNLGSSVSHSVLDIFNRVEEELRTGLEPEFKDDLPGEAQETLADITEAKKLGWSPKTDIKTGIQSSIDFIRKNVLK